MQEPALGVVRSDASSGRKLTTASAAAASCAAMNFTGPIQFGTGLVVSMDLVLDGRTGKRIVGGSAVDPASNITVWAEAGGRTNGAARYAGLFIVDAGVT